MKTGSMLAAALLLAAFASNSAKADDEGQNQMACASDAMTICSQFIPDRARVAGCLMSNRSRISGACRAQLAHWRG
jgi:hypothetical protein